MFKFWKRSQQSEFEALTLPHLDALYNVALRLSHNENEAEDLVQETYLKAYRFFHRFQQGTHIRAWLFKILTNTFINQYRKQQRDRELIEDWDWDHIISSDEDCYDNENKLLDKFVSEQVISAIRNIPIEFQTVVLLSDLEDFTYKEIAEILGCPIGTVMSRLYRGRRILRHLLREYAEEQGYIEKERLESDETCIDKVANLANYRRNHK
jgi:RNA polymerase sigma-70 factor (ECF subfamily)